MSGSQPGFFSKLGSVFDRYGAFAASTFGSLILAFSGALTPSLDDLAAYSRWQTLIVYFGAGFATVGAFSLARAVGTVDKLASQNNQLRDLVKSLGNDIEEKWRHLLIQIANECKLDNKSRISIYRHEGAHFIMLARFSIDPNKRKTGRGFYPAEQGCIGAAYRDGESIIQSFPDPSTDAYVQANLRQSVPAAVVAGFKMKPRSIVAFAIAERDTYDRPLVLVYESTEESAFVLRRLKSVTTNYNDTLCSLYKTLEPLLPSLSYARQEGF
jgi:hypothetical protein